MKKIELTDRLLIGLSNLPMDKLPCNCALKQKLQVEKGNLIIKKEFIPMFSDVHDFLILLKEDGVF